jgi:hypothetical protein
VRTFDLNGNPILSFMAYDPAFRGGVNVASGHLSGTSPSVAFVTAPASGSGPDVRVFGTFYNNASYPRTIFVSQTHEFAAYDPAFRGGVSVGVALVGQGGGDAILTGAGPGGGPHVLFWSLTATGAAEPVASFMAFDPGFTGGVFVG